MSEVRRFSPRELGKRLRERWEVGSVPKISLLVGAGFSKSAGVPMANEMIELLKDQVGERDVPKEANDYQFWLSQLPSQSERVEFIKKCLNEARMEKGNEDTLFKVNFAHLSLATLVEKRCVNRILTTNFDPLIADALSFSSQPVRTYDVNSAARYPTGVLSPGTAVYLHGQMHSALLANTNTELERVKSNYGPVFQDALQDSCLIVVGYSGECDGVIASLLQQTNSLHGIYWAHFGKWIDHEASAIRKLNKTLSDVSICEGDDADADHFMFELLVGLGFDLPLEITNPEESMIRNQKRLQGFPELRSDSGREESIESLVKGNIERLEGYLKSVSSLSVDVKPAEVTILDIELAYIFEQWDKLEAMRVEQDMEDPISQTYGKALTYFAYHLSLAGQHGKAVETAERAIQYGVPADYKPWEYVTLGDALAGRARATGDLSLYDRAFEKYEKAIEIKPDFHQTWNNWGNNLSNKAQATGDPSLYDQAFEKYEKAIEIKPDFHEAWNNWGTDLGNKAQATGDLSLYDQAFEKYAKAVKIKPDFHDAWFNIGCAKSLKNNIVGCLEALEKWRTYTPKPTREDLDDDTDFDNVRNTPEFIAFRDSLPE